jgi:hypothetical protein
MVKNLIFVEQNKNLFEKIIGATLAFSIGISVLLLYLVEINAETLGLILKALTLMFGMMGGTSLVGIAIGLILKSKISPIFSFGIFAIFAILLSFILEDGGVYIFIPIALYTLWEFVKSIKNSNAKIKLTLIGLMFGFLGASVYVRLMIGNYVSPLSFERIAYTGLHLDQLFHVAIGNMQQLHGLTSLGLDGLRPLNGYFLGEFIFSRFQTLLNMKGMEFYNFGYPVAIISLWMFTVLIALTEASFSGNKNNRLSVNNPSIFYGGIFIYLYVYGFYPSNFNQQFNGLPGLGIFAENYLLALVLSNICIVLWSRLIRQGAGILNEEKNIKLIDIALLFITLALIFIKPHIAIIVFVVSIYLNIRLFSLKKSYKYLFSIATILILAFYIFLGKVFYDALILHGVGDPLESRWLYFPIKYFSGEYLVLFPLFYLLLPAIYIFLRLKSLECNSSIEVINYLKIKKLLDLEVLLIVYAIALIALCYRWTIHYAGISYFIDFPTYLALFMLANFFIKSPSIKLIKFYSRPLLCLVFFSLVACWFGNLGQNFKDAGLLLLDTQNKILSTRNVGVPDKCGKFKIDDSPVYKISVLAQQIDCAISSIRLYHKRIPLVGFEMKSEKNDDSGKRNKLIFELKNLSNLENSYKRERIIYINQNATFFWNAYDAWPVRQLCDPSPYIVPALSGIPLLDGVKRESCPEGYFGLSGYYRGLGKDRIVKVDSDTEKINACQRAKSLGFLHIIYFDDNQKYEDINCKNLIGN